METSSNPAMTAGPIVPMPRMRWNQAALGGLPFVIAGLVIAVPSLLFVLAGEPKDGLAGPLKLVSTVLTLILGAIFLAGLAYAWRRRWPAWSAAWSGFGLAAVAAVLIFSAQAFDRNYYGLAQSMLIVGAPLFLGAALVFVARRSPRAALIAALPSALILWSPTLEFSQPAPRALVQLYAWLLAGGLAAVLLRGVRLSESLWLFAGFNLATGLPYGLVRELLNRLPPQYASQPVTVGTVMEQVLPPLIALPVLAAGPVLILALRREMHGRGRLADIGSYLAILGTYLQCAAELGAFWWMTSVGSQRALLPADFGQQVTLFALLYDLGVVATGVGLILCWIVLEKGRRACLGLAAAALLALPIAVIFPLANNVTLIPAGFPLPMVMVNVLRGLAGYLAGMAAMLLVLVAASRLSPQAEDPSGRPPA